MPLDSSSPSPAESRRIAELLEALRAPVEVSILPGSWLLNERFAAEFQSRLLCQHLFMKSVVAQASFDSALIAAAEVGGHQTTAASEGQRFWDVEIAGRKISLKSTKAKSIHPEKLHVSKLTEAAWIQDCRTARMRRDHVRELFGSYCDTVSSIIQLRYFHQDCRYELVEIPVSLFRSILDLTLGSFASESTTINIPVGQTPPDFTLKLDRSDAKITLANIAKSKCVVHGSWKILAPDNALTTLHELGR